MQPDRYGWLQNFAGSEEGKEKLPKVWDRRQFTSQFNDWNFPEINLAHDFFHLMALKIEGR